MSSRNFTDIQGLEGAIFPPYSPLEENLGVAPEPSDVVADEQGREWVHISEIKLDPRNAREHNEEGIEKIAGSLCQYGQQAPIVVSRVTGIVKAGNGRLMAAQLLSDTIPHWQRLWVVYTDLEEKAATAFALDDNRTNQFSGWKWEQVSETVRDLLGNGLNVLEVLSFPDHELEPLLAGTGWLPKEEGSPKVAKAKTEPKERKTKQPTGNTSARFLLELTGDAAVLFEWSVQHLREKSGEQLTQEAVINSIIGQWVADERAIEGISEHGEGNPEYSEQE